MGYSGSDIEEQGQLYLEASDFVCSHASDWRSSNSGEHSGAYWDMLDDSVSGDLGNLFLHYVAYEVQCNRYADDFQVWLEERGR